MNKFIKFIALAVCLLSQPAWAKEFDKPLTTMIVVNNQSRLASPAGVSAKFLLPSRKMVTLMNIKLTSTQKQHLNEASHIQQIAESDANLTIDLPRRADRGMNGTPVLDQGMHGTCVTFANTAAIDALLGKGDYVSELCNLQLGTLLEQKSYLPSGWKGSFGPIVLNQMLGFGIINKVNQVKISCGGLRDYPRGNPDYLGDPMSLDEYRQSSEDISGKLYWDPLLTFTQRMQWNSQSLAQASALLNEVKKTLATKTPWNDSRLTFATLLPVNHCSAGACARYHAEDDTWALTKSIAQDQDAEIGGHEMVITGYDDDAVAIDNEGNKHQGLLILRNSWGSDAGDQGNYYMAYDFFKVYVAEVQKIVIEK